MQVMAHNKVTIIVTIKFYIVKNSKEIINFMGMLDLALAPNPKTISSLFNVWVYIILGIVLWSSFNGSFIQNFFYFILEEVFELAGHGRINYENDFN